MKLEEFLKRNSLRLVFIYEPQAKKPSEKWKVHFDSEKTLAPIERLRSRVSDHCSIEVRGVGSTMKDAVEQLVISVQGERLRVGTLTLDIGHLTVGLC